jgi:hypothetical protein
VFPPFANALLVAAAKVSKVLVAGRIITSLWLKASRKVHVGLAEELEMKLRVMSDLHWPCPFLVRLDFCEPCVVMVNSVLLVMCTEYHDCVNSDDTTMQNGRLTAGKS